MTETPTTDEFAGEPERTLRGRFELYREMGPGRRARTWYGRDLESGEPIVAKQLTLEETPDWKAVELFEREAETLELLDGAHTPNYIDSLSADPEGEHPEFFLIYEYVEGTDLQTLLDEGEPFGEFEVRYTVEKLLRTLAPLHRRTPPVVHRDVKPANVIRRPDGSLALIDFGAVQLVVRETVGGSTIVGTSGYLPPEQLMGRAKPASDLYGVGATAVHLLTGRHPADLEVDKNRLQFREHADVRPDFAAFLDRLLAPAPEERFDDAGEALEVLQSDVLSKKRGFARAREAARSAWRGLAAGLERRVGRWAGAAAALAVAVAAGGLVAWSQYGASGAETAEQSRSPRGLLVEPLERQMEGWRTAGSDRWLRTPTLQAGLLGEHGIEMEAGRYGVGAPHRVWKRFEPSFPVSNVTVRFGGWLTKCATVGLFLRVDGRERPLWTKTGGGTFPEESRSFPLDEPVDGFALALGEPRDADPAPDDCSGQWRLDIEQVEVRSNPLRTGHRDPVAPEDDETSSLLPPLDPFVEETEPEDPEPRPRSEGDPSDDSGDACGRAEEPPLRENFEDGNLDGWTAERQTRSANIRDGVLRLEGTRAANGDRERGMGPRHGSEALWRRTFRVERSEQLQFAGAMRMELRVKSRDQKTAVRFRLLDANCNDVGEVVYYSRWEGRTGELSEACEADRGRGWCTQWGKPTTVRGGDTYLRDLRAHGKWVEFRTEFAGLLDEPDFEVDPDDVAYVQVVLESRGAWGKNGVGAFDSVSLGRDLPGTITPPL